MTPSFNAKQDFDLDDLPEPQMTGMFYRLSDDDGDAASPTTGRRRCVDCGSPIPDGSKYCPSCGREQ